MSRDDLMQIFFIPGVFLIFSLIGLEFGRRKARKIDIERSASVRAYSGTPRMVVDNSADPEALENAAIAIREIRARR